MTEAVPTLGGRLRQGVAAICLGASLGMAGFGAASVLVPTVAQARGPEGIADVAEKVIDAVVNISTTQNVEAKGGDTAFDAFVRAGGAALRRHARLQSRRRRSSDDVVRSEVHFAQRREQHGADQY